MQRRIGKLVTGFLCLATWASPAMAGEHLYRIRKFVGELPAQASQPPFSFSFANLSDQSVDTVVSSAPISLAGLAMAMSATISGPAAAEPALSTDGGLTWETSLPVSGSSSLMLRMKTAPTAGTATAVTVHIGPWAATWQTTTAGTATYPPPSFLSSPVTDATVGEPFVYNIAADTPETGTALVIEAITQPAWTSFTDYGDWTAMLWGTPPPEAATGEPPAFTSTGITTATYGGMYDYTVEASDPVGTDLLAISVVDKPDWLALKHVYLMGVGAPYGYRATLTGIPPRATPGTNQTPAFTSTETTSATQGGIYDYTVTTSDADGTDMLTVSVVDKPSWLALKRVYLMGVGAPHGFRVSLTGVPPVFPAPVNVAPTFTSTPATAAQSGVAYSYAISVADQDPADILAMAATVPAWLTFTYNGNRLRTATLAGTPGAGDVGPNSVSLHVSDQTGLSADQPFTITVSP